MHLTLHTKQLFSWSKVTSVTDRLERYAVKLGLGRYQLSGKNDPPKIRRIDGLRGSKLTRYWLAAVSYELEGFEAIPWIPLGMSEGQAQDKLAAIARAVAKVQSSVYADIISPDIVSVSKNSCEVKLTQRTTSSALPLGTYELCESPHPDVESEVMIGLAIEELLIDAYAENIPDNPDITAAEILSLAESNTRISAVDSRALH